MHMSQSRGWFVSLTGILSVPCFFAGLILWDQASPGPPNAEEVLRFYAENGSSVRIGSTLFGVGAVLFLFFVGSLWRVLRSAEGPTGYLANVAFGGGAVATAGILWFSQLGATLAENARFIDPLAAQAIESLRHPAVLLTGGMAILLVACGLSFIRTKVLPAWLGWLALALGAASVSRAGFLAFMVSWLWIIVVSVLLMRGRSSTPVGPGA